MRFIGSAIALWLFVGCAGTDGDEAPRTAELNAAEAEAATSDPRDEVGATRASREAASAPTAPDTVSPTLRVPDLPTSPTTSATASPATRVRPLLTLRSDVDVARAEDGRGSMIAATQPLAFDIDAARVPIGARDPVLAVGALRFRDYAYLHAEVLRFVVADRALLTAGDEVSVQYGDDASTRIVLSRSLRVTQ